MLTRLIKIQLVIFTVVGTIGVIVMAFAYIQVPTLLGLGRLTVKVQMPASGGLYRFSNVTYRGVEVGKVTGVELTPDGAEATMRIATSPKIPADLQAEIRSISAVGEQYVDLRPRTDSGPYLQDGAVITAANVSLPQPVGPVLDRVSTLVDTFPKDRLSALLDETYKGLNGASDDFGSLLDSGATLSADLNGIADQTRALADDSRPLLASQADTVDSIRTWARSLAGFTGQLADNDPQFRAVLAKGPAFADETSSLLSQLKPTLPVLLANLGTVSEILMTYNASLEQLLVLLPPYVAQQQAYTTSSDSTGAARGDFAATVSDPPPCTVGFLPPSSWRSPDDESDIDTPDGLYCKLPQDSPVAVRGARNYPCIRHPGKRAPTVAICNSDKPFTPLAMRQHGLGPYPIDPSLIAQGIPIDDRTDFNDNIHAPLEGTPLPPGAVPLGTPPGAPPGAAPLSPLEAPFTAAAVPPPPPPTGNSLNGVPIPPLGPAPGPAPEIMPDPAAAGPAPGPAVDGAAPQVAPSSFGTATPTAGPKVAVAEYNPRTGEYVGSNGKVYKVTNLVAGARLGLSWKDLLPH
ncbi:mammalian cell entry protein [Mycobacterium antarcticum]|uniref:MCE family protein n=1 Tax=unclassified Mycolicibacterium TaxID=2636767 RepID=UPI0023878278|nr:MULTISPECIES: MlaD family protein [unclassified Mycolicibacterium]BDX31142.1 mammalian cell entry protein [Mycolicibacterium sp. TUM20985]GLP74494.1 mammalian cell entry protein [Mycolicibacterium sp. TUM20983]GLP80289.1 mammalian cell entry protein [Mycolicibacterium sp. TUM20984]